MNEIEILYVDNKRKKGAHPSQLRYMKNRYYTDEEYRNNQIKNAIIHYTKIREELMDKYKNDEEYRKLRSEKAKIYYEKNKEEIKAKREAKKAREAEKKAIEELEELGGHIMDIS